jgi:hypothetical protein
MTVNSLLPLLDPDNLLLQPAAYPGDQLRDHSPKAQRFWFRRQVAAAFQFRKNRTPFSAAFNKAVQDHFPDQPDVQEAAPQH